MYQVSEQKFILYYHHFETTCDNILVADLGRVAGVTSHPLKGLKKKMCSFQK